MLRIPRPTQSHPKPPPRRRCRLHARSPTRAPSCVHLQIRNLRGNSLRRRAKRHRKAHQWDMPVTIRHGLSIPINQPHARATFQQRFQRPHANRDHPRSPIREDRRVPNELNRVPHSLLGVQQNCFPRDIRMAGRRDAPLPPRIEPQGVPKRIAIPPRLIFTPPALIVSKGDETHRPLPARLRVAKDQSPAPAARFP